MDLIAKSLMGSYAKGPIDPYFEYTTLLLSGNGLNGAQNGRSGPAAAYRDGTFLDSSTNNFTITRNGNTTQGTFSPFSQTGWGNHFDGTSDAIYLDGGTPLTFGTGNFTIEFWVYYNGSLTVDRALYDSRPTSANGLYPLLFSNPSGKMVYYVNSAARITSTTNLVTGVWYHVALTRSGTDTKLFINGTQEGSTYSDSNNYIVGTNRPSIGAAGILLGADPLNGYMSNVRVVKGTAVYTGAFTPPTAPLTAISGTSLLTCQSNRFIDNSTNNFTITRNGDTSVVAFSPFNPTASWSAATYGGSGYFDGSGDYLQIAANSAFQFDGNFTVECWFYSGTGTTASKYDQIVGTIESASTGYWRLGSEFNGGKQFWFSWTTGSYNDILTSFSVSDNAWHHLAVTRISNSVRLFVDGVQKGSTTTVTTNLTASAPLMVMNTTQGANQTQGYVGSLRIIKGQGLYNGTFTPSTAPFTTTSVGSTGAGAASSITGTVGVLLNFTNAGIYDATSKNDLETVGSAQISTTQSQFGGSSIYLNGSGSYLKAPPTQNIAIGTVFTVECWVYLTSWGAGSPHIFDVRTSNIVGAMYLVSSDGTARFQTTGTGVIASKSGVTLNAWTHIAFVSDATSSRVYVNGSNTGGTNQGQAQWPTTPPGYAWIGANFSAGDVIYGYIQDFRVTKYARYTSNFTPPTAAFPTL